MAKKSKPFLGIVLVGLKGEGAFDEIWEVSGEDYIEFLGTMEDFIKGTTGFDRKFEKKILKAYESLKLPRDKIEDPLEKGRILMLIDKWYRENADVPEDYSGYFDRFDELVVYKLIEYKR
jgi:hypothetical protein